MGGIFKAFVLNVCSDLSLSAISKNIRKKESWRVIPMKTHMLFAFVLSCLVFNSDAYSMSGKGLKCPDLGEVHTALAALQKEPEDSRPQDIFEAHPEWDSSPQCVEKVFRNFIALPPKQEGAEEKPVMTPDLKAVREGFAASLQTFTLLKKPDVVVPQKVVHHGGIKFVKFSDDKKPDVVILYLHGGGYILSFKEAGVLYTDMLSQLVKGVNAEVYVPYYRVRPEHPLSASLDDAYKAYSALVKLGVSPEQVVVMGDSAGGGLALRLLLKLKQKKEKMPRMEVLLSPWTDLSNSGKSFQENANTDMFSNVEGIDVFTKGVLGKNNPKDPMVSPLFGDYTGFPKLVYVVSGSEIFRDDTLRDVEKARGQGVEVELIRHEDTIHVYPGSSRFLESGRDALKQIIEKVKAP